MSQPQVEIAFDGITVWVNDANGCNIARFGRFGIDVHRPLNEQATEGQCLYCTAGEVTKEDWETFKREVLRHHGVTVTDKYKPMRFR